MINVKAIQKEEAKHVQCRNLILSLDGFSILLLI